ncbi:hypothetical protein BLNAU_2129 [Blattamonas nauphoetae]|uniref:Uncharacterized protein n=1 Tax=Blattamonas nauphoetae TaxID=2049346 RepID=A0ABQ9YH68_9EUKA|nr:hypothetical protein BLNAU_2129 [Blattamonas nauphoetae]
MNTCSRPCCGAACDNTINHFEVRDVVSYKSFKIERSSPRQIICCRTLLEAARIDENTIDSTSIHRSSKLGG